MIKNWLLFVTYLVAIIIEIGLPVFLAVLIIRKFKVSWLVVLTGVITFIASQVVHIPLLYGLSALFQKGILPTPPQQWVALFNAVTLGLLAGICEETARWVGFKVLKAKAKPFKSALALGIGHGGIESVIVGGVVAFSLVSVLFYNPQAQLASGTAAGTVQAMQAQISQFWATAWHLPLAGGYERILAISSHLVMSIFVWKSVVKHSAWWFLLAVLYHAVLDGVAVSLSGLGLTAWQLEGALSIFLILNVVLLYRFWVSEKNHPDSTENEDHVGAEKTLVEESSIPNGSL